jgi:hypothetical protein
MLALTKLGVEFLRGVQVRGSASHFSRPTPTLTFANGSPFPSEATCRISQPQVERRPIRRRASSQPYSPTVKTLSTKSRYIHPPAPLQSTVPAP